MAWHERLLLWESRANGEPCGVANRRDLLISGSRSLQDLGVHVTCEKNASLEKTAGRPADVLFVALVGEPVIIFQSLYILLG